MQVVFLWGWSFVVVFWKGALPWEWSFVTHGLMWRCMLFSAGGLSWQSFTGVLYNEGVPTAQWSFVVCHEGGLSWWSDVYSSPVSYMVFSDGLMSKVLLYHTWSFLTVWCLRFYCIIHAFTIPLQTNHVHGHCLKTFSNSKVKVHVMSKQIIPTLMKQQPCLEAMRFKTKSTINKLPVLHSLRQSTEKTDWMTFTSYSRNSSFLPVEIVIPLSMGKNGLQSYRKLTFARW